MKLIDLFRKVTAVDIGVLEPGMRGYYPIADIEFIARLDLRPGDILVIKCKQHLTFEAAANMRETFKMISKDHKIMVIDGGADLAVLSAADIEAHSTPTSGDAA